VLSLVATTRRSWLRAIVAWAQRGIAATHRDSQSGVLVSDARLTLHIGPDRAGCTLAELVRSAWPEPCPWSRAREVCKRGKVSRNGQVERDSAIRVEAGDVVDIDPHAQRVREHVLPDSAVVFCDPQIVVVNKPAGLITVPFDPGEKNTLVDRLRFWLRRKAGVQGAELGVVQRLDKDTTGLLVFARSLAAKRALQQQFRVHDIERRYLALAHGDVAAESFDTVLVRDRGDGLRGSFGVFRRPRGTAPHDAQRAITQVRPIERLGTASLVECQLQTGRQHQIRIHLSERGHPLLGEPVYVRDFAGPLIAAPRPMLHAAVLGFAHPKNGAPMHFEEPPPEDFQNMLSALRARLND
jgi:23S rRNA pseudouridine1911/1915/1917 synthase